MFIGVAAPNLELGLRGTMESEPENLSEASARITVVEQRRCPRFKLDVDITITPRGGEILRGRAVDISETGISAMLKIEVAVGVVVELSFPCPLDEVTVLAVVRQRNAFRYGFQFADPDDTRERIRCACRRLLPCS